MLGIFSGVVMDSSGRDSSDAKPMGFFADDDTFADWSLAFFI